MPAFDCTILPVFRSDALAKGRVGKIANSRKLVSRELPLVNMGCTLGEEGLAHYRLRCLTVWIVGEWSEWGAFVGEWSDSGAFVGEWSEWGAFVGELSEWGDLWVSGVVGGGQLWVNGVSEVSGGPDHHCVPLCSISTGPTV